MQLFKTLFSPSCFANACRGDDVGPLYRPVHTERKRMRKRKKLKEQWGNINEKISNIKEYFRFFAFALCEWTLRYDLTQNVP